MKGLNGFNFKNWGINNMQDFKKLIVWRKSHLLVLSVYKVTANFPDNEKYGLTSQIRRSAASIPTNIAEGCGRKSKAEFTHFLNISMGSASELEYQLLLANDLHLVTEKEYDQLQINLIEVKRMLSSLTNKISI